MKIFLIDTENVGWQGIRGSESLSSSDEVYLFTTDVFNASKSFSLEIIKIFLSSCAKFSFINIGKTNALKNYLDFQLCTFLGSFMERNQDAQAVIVSKDKGYQSVVDYWHHNNREVYLAPDIKTHMSKSRNNCSLEKKHNAAPIKTNVQEKKTNQSSLNKQALKKIPKANNDNLKLFKVPKEEVEKKEAPSKYRKHIRNTIKKHYPKLSASSVNKRVNRLKEIKNPDKLKKNCISLFGKTKGDTIYAEIFTKFTYNNQ